MPKFNNMQKLTVPGSGNFQFSAIRPDNLGATEYTLVTIVVDITASVAEFAKELLETVKSVISACQRSPRADNLMVRLLLFNDRRQEVHGFVPLSQIDPGAYKPLKCRNATALYDAVYDAVGATNQYAKKLFAKDFDVNGAIYIITDGMDNCSTMPPAAVANQVRSAMKQEYMESLITVLVGVDTNEASVSAHLQLFKDEAQLTQFVDVADASSDNLAKLGSFVSKSISMQSQALGTGAPSQSLTF
ncbi:MAG: VWA domain-containing protein [Gammaproteobacteria bacterium]|nr:VWA domain-containing protein [Gammaproteobacteria bacterium]